jgi:ribosomal protein S18 acetylase RimI-like enzyme
MSVHVRPLADGDFFSWLGLYEGYGEFYNTTITDEKALLAWSWIEGVVAVDEDRIVGLAHFYEFPRPVYGGRGLYIDDLYVEPQARRVGVGHQLIEYARSIAHSRGLDIVRWVTESDNTIAQKLYNEVGSRTDWITYDLLP